MKIYTSNLIQNMNKNCLSISFRKKKHHFDILLLYMQCYELIVIVFGVKEVINRQ